MAFFNALRWLLADVSRPAKLSNARAWLFAIARNILYSWSKRKRPKTFSSVRDEFSDEGVMVDVEIPDPAVVCALSDLEYKERLQALNDCLDELPEPGRSLVIKRYVDSVPFKDLVAQSSAPQGTVAVWLHRAVKRVQDCVEKRLGIDQGGNAA